MILINTSNESNHADSCLANCVDPEEILYSVTFLQQSHASLSSLHSIYLNIIKDIQINIIDQLKNDQFEEPYFIASTTANFVREIMNDLKLSNSKINKQITEFQQQNPKYEELIISSKLKMSIFYDFFVNCMSDLEDNLRANAMIKAGKTSFTQNDKNQIAVTLTNVIYQYSQNIVFPNNLIGTFLGKLNEKLIKLGIKYISLKHINNSILISNKLIIK